MRRASGTRRGKGGIALLLGAVLALGACGGDSGTSASDSTSSTAARDADDAGSDTTTSSQPALVDGRIPYLDGVYEGTGNKGPRPTQVVYHASPTDCQELAYRIGDVTDRWWETISAKRSESTDGYTCAVSATLAEDEAGNYPPSMRAEFALVLDGYAPAASASPCGKLEQVPLDVGFACLPPLEDPTADPAASVPGFAYLDDDGDLVLITFEARRTRQGQEVRQLVRDTVLAVAELVILRPDEPATE